MREQLNMLNGPSCEYDMGLRPYSEPVPELDGQIISLKQPASFDTDQTDESFEDNDAPDSQSDSDPIESSADGSRLTLVVSCLSLLALSGNIILTARGGNYKVVRQNLLAQRKANGKEPMPPEQRLLRRRKRKKK